MQRPNCSLLRRYCVFGGGILFTALGVALITQAGLGTSAVSSLSYVLTFVFPGLSMGVFTFLVNLAMFLAQVLILRRDFKPLQLLQVPATFLFSFCIDLWMYLLRGLAPASYLGRWAFLLLACLSLGIGVALQVLPDVLILPGEGFVNVLSRRFHWNFGVVKTATDVGMVAAAALVSLLCLGGVHGLREGTLVSALIVGAVARFCQKHLAFTVAPRRARAKAPGLADPAV